MDVFIKGIAIMPRVNMSAVKKYKFCLKLSRSRIRGRKIKGINFVPMAKDQNIPDLIG